MKKNTRISLKKACIVSSFIALCYVGVMINIPIPSPIGKPMFHLGNLIMLLCALLFGGVIGGSVGAVGMGLYDIIHGYGIWTIKTILLKFIMGFTGGSIFHHLKINKKSYKSWHFYLFAILFFIVGGFFLVIRIFLGETIYLKPVNSNFIVYWPLYIFPLIIGIGLIIIGILLNKVSDSLQWAFIASVIAVGVNIFGEFIAKVIKSVIIGNSFSNSLLLAVLSLPASLINGVFCLVGVFILFPPLEKCFKVLNYNKEINQ